MSRQRMTWGLTVLAVCGALWLPGCAGEDEEERFHPYPVEMPDPPPGIEGQTHTAGVRTHLTTLTLGTTQVTDMRVALEHDFDITDSGPEPVIDHYDQELTALDWKPVAGLTEINGAPAASWERDDQRVTVFVLSMEEGDIAMVLKHSNQWELP